MANARLALQMLAPTILCQVSVSCPGYFQAYDTDFNLADHWADICGNLCTWCPSLFSIFLQQEIWIWSDRVLLVLPGTGAGGGIRADPLRIVYAVNRGIIRKRIANDHHSVNESMGRNEQYCAHYPIIPFIYKCKRIYQQLHVFRNHGYPGAAKDVIQGLCILSTDIIWHWSLSRWLWQVQRRLPWSRRFRTLCMYDIAGANTKTDGLRGWYTDFIGSCSSNPCCSVRSDR